MIGNNLLKQNKRGGEMNIILQYIYCKQNVDRTKK